MENEKTVTPQEQKEQTPVNFDRNTPFESGLEYNPEYYYRMIGESGYDDFLDTGIIQAKSESKQAYDKAYYFKGHPLARYTDQRSRVQFFVEVKPAENLFDDTGSYPFSNRPITSADQIRIYQHSIDGVEVVFDSFKDQEGE